MTAWGDAFLFFMDVLVFVVFVFIVIGIFGVFFCSEDVGVFMRCTTNGYSVVMERKFGQDRPLFYNEDYETVKAVYMSYPDSLRLSLKGE